MSDPTDDPPREPAPQETASRRSRKGKHSRPPSRRRRWFVRSVVAVAVVIMLAAGAAAGYVWYLNGRVKRVSVHNLISGPAPGGTENILIAGSTDRCGLKTSSPAFGSCADGVNGVNSDVIMIVHLDSARHTASLLSIPRDLFIPNARTTGPGKIDAALFQGPSQLVAAIEQDFAIPINHYVELNFDGFQGVVNAVGGVNMYFPEPVFDGNSGLNIAAPGCVHLDGFQALALVRARHLQYKPPTVTTKDPYDWPQDPESDLSRIRRDHEFLRVLGTALSHRNLADPVSDQKLIYALLPQVKVDSTMSFGHMVDLVTTFHGLDPNTVPQVTLPVSVINSLSYYYRGSNYGSIEFPDVASDQLVIDQFLGAAPGTDTMTGNPLPAPGAVTVKVVNGSSEDRQAGVVAFDLGLVGFHPLVGGSETPVGPLAETFVKYASPADQPAAEQVARSLQGPVVLAYDPSATGAQVTVLTGTGLSVKPESTAATTTTAVRNDLIGPTTPAVNPLAQFDPRSCTADGGPGA